MFGQMIESLPLIAPAEWSTTWIRPEDRYPDPAQPIPTTRPGPFLFSVASFVHPEPLPSMIDSLPRVIQAPLLQLRWLSVAAMVLAALISPYLLGPSELTIRLLAFAGGIGLFNLGFLVAARSMGVAKVPKFFSPLAQLSFDLLAWGGYIFLSGGATNPLISLFLPLVAIGALVLSPSQAWLLALAAILIYSFLWYFYVPLHIADFQMAGTLHLFGMWLVFALSAVLVVGFILHLSGSIRRRDQELGAARERAIRDDWLISLGCQAAGAAHELGTPLATLNILADDLLDDGRLAPELATDIQAMKAEIQRCKATLGQLVARAGLANTDEPPCYPATEWLRQLLLTWQGQHPQVEVHLDFAQTLNDRHLPADLGIEHALTNLLNNAIKARASHIQVSVAEHADILEVRIADNGTGMDPGALVAFERRQPRISAESLGVGLQLGRAAIERRGGSLHFLPPGPEGAGTIGALAQLRLPLTTTAKARHGG